MVAGRTPFGDRGGVRLDVGHSGTDFRFREARRLMDLGYRPHTAGTECALPGS